MPTTRGLRVQVELNPASQTAVDKIVNTWHIFLDGSSTPTAGNYTSFATAFKTFYNALGTAMPTDLLYTSNWRVKIYNLEQPEPRVPAHDEYWTPSGLSNTDALPPEVALCVSLQCAKVSGQPPGRNRGRVYLGPWIYTQSVDGRPTSSIITSVKNATNTLRSDVAAVMSSVSYLGVYSPSDNLVKIVTGGWIDNEWDTQRRRGRAATTRTSL